MRLRVLVGLATAVLAACAPAASDGASARQVKSAKVARHPVSGLAVIPLTVTSGDKRHIFRVEVARSEAEQEKGLMFRPAMGADEGMIFPMEPPRLASFWMKNTVIPLDLVFIGTDRRVLNIASDTEPYSLTPIYSSGAVIAVLELNGGRAEALGIAMGDRVEW